MEVKTMEYSKIALTETKCEASIRDQESIFKLVAKSEEIARNIEETVRVLDGNLFGCGEHDTPPDEPRCFRDVCAQHAERMARIDAMLNSIKERLGV
jgi:hypothetical protein